MTSVRAALIVGVCGVAVGQMPGHQKQEVHPPLSTQTCTKAGGCTTKQNSVTIDANWRWVHTKNGYTNCYSGSEWDKRFCPDPATCAKNCELEGANHEYPDVYGVHTDAATLKLRFKTGSNIGSRNYLLEDDSKYQHFKLKNREFTFDADVSQLPCGLNGALYFVAMDADGGMSKYSGNQAGAKYGVGYCDAQCPRDLKFINGEANVLDWNATGGSTGLGKYGSCCQEMDIWEANSISTAFTAHSCSSDGQTRCEGKDCGTRPGERNDALCDKSGCDFQTFRLGKKDFWGSGASFDIDTSKPVTVVTQFITEDGTDTGALAEIRRHYVQNGKRIDTPKLKVGSSSFNSLSKDYCEAEVGLFKDHTNFLQKGGLESMDAAMTKGMVLVMSLWDDATAQMRWLDSNYPADANPSIPGVARGTCSKDAGNPSYVEMKYPDASVTFANIKFGEIGSTDSSSPSSGCPGKSLSACIQLCPANPPAAYRACVEDCAKRCAGDQWI
eukprot:TRINITY_DN4332_c0_g5_i1.p1 TRINITY_DN4332_c0_g5~~TRINITY_DN4332_c0_g5_i1.p1  ORF type:complete len:522 (+),score=89.82 TRINITY_DN4332_c0_g5_i1:72-1568(+)